MALTNAPATFECLMEKLLAGSQGVQCNREILPVVNWEVPVTLVGSFLGFTNYYQKFIKGFERSLPKVETLNRGVAIR